jgi:hypothetical protein
MPPPTSPARAAAAAAAAPYRRRLATATIVSVGLMTVLYTATLRSGSSTNNNQAIIRVSNTGPVVLPQAELDQLEKSALNTENCPFHPPVETLEHRQPVWVAGYPGSGFDFVAHLIAAVTGVTTVDVYRHHTCHDRLVRDGAAPTGACLTHWPLVQRDSPTAIAASSGTMYYQQAVFVIRNPAHAIPSYHTRWWGAQQSILGNHVPPNVTKWQKWRNKRLSYHLDVWKQSLTEWVRGVPAAGISGVGLVLPFEQLQSAQNGPNITLQVARFFTKEPSTSGGSGSKRSKALSSNSRYDHLRYSKCVWRRVYDDEHHPPKEYTAAYTKRQKQLFLDTLDELIASYKGPSTSHPTLSESNRGVIQRVLQGYRDDIHSHLVLDQEDGTR